MLINNCRSILDST